MTYLEFDLDLAKMLMINSQSGLFTLFQKAITALV